VSAYTAEDVLALEAERDAFEDTDKWVSKEDAEHEVCLQAGAIAKKLGHDIQSWSRGFGRVYGLCLRCLERVAIAPRGFAEPPMRGVPVQFECRPRRGS
jgi:hypothetical protein